MIIVENLYKTYGTDTLQVEVLKDVNLGIADGEFVAIMGPSGSGKSTLLYLMGGLDKPTSGRICIDDKDLSDMDDKNGSILRRRSVGFVFQFYNLVPNLSVEENVLLPVLLDGGSAKRFRDSLDELLRIVGLEHRRNHTPRELSGGEQQRVAIARALINNPNVILADEPTGNLDSSSGENIMALLQRVHAENKKTIVMVTHSNIAAGYAERIVRVQDGRLLETEEADARDE